MIGGRDEPGARPTQWPENLCGSIVKDGHTEFKKLRTIGYDGRTISKYRQLGGETSWPCRLRRRPVPLVAGGADDRQKLRSRVLVFTAPSCENLISVFSDLIEPCGLLPGRAERDERQRLPGVQLVDAAPHP